METSGGEQGQVQDDPNQTVLVAPLKVVDFFLVLADLVILAWVHAWVPAHPFHEAACLQVPGDPFLKK